MTQGKGQGSDEVQAQVLGRPQEDPSSKTLDKRPPLGYNNSVFSSVPATPQTLSGRAPALWGQMQGRGALARRKAAGRSRPAHRPPSAVMCSPARQRLTALLCLAAGSEHRPCVWGSLGRPAVPALEARDVRLGREDAPCSVLRAPGQMPSRKHLGWPRCFPGPLGPWRAVSGEWATSAETWLSVPKLAGPARCPGSTEPPRQADSEPPGLR